MMITRRTLLQGVAATAAALPVQRASRANRGGCFSMTSTSRARPRCSEKALGLNGTPVEIVGFMAPPLKAESPFFVLTDIPMETCPFCDDIAFWPDNIIYATSHEDLPMVPFDRQIRVAGTLEVGEKTDPETGFVSLVRLTQARVTRS